MGRVKRLHAAYSGRAAFLFVAIRDAGHPGPEMRRLADGADAGQRRRYVLEGLAVYGLPFPALLDEDGAVERAYEAFPQRAVVVGADGLVAYDGGWGEAGGPSDWDFAELEVRLRAALRLAPERRAFAGRTSPPHPRSAARAAGGGTAHAYAPAPRWYLLVPID